MEAIVDRVSPPEGDESAFASLIFDSVFNPFRGIEAYFKVVNGTIRKGDKVKFFATEKEYFADEIGALKLNQELEDIKAGDVGYIISGIKVANEVKVGDTITLTDAPCNNPIGFEDVKPMVFAGIYL